MREIWDGRKGPGFVWKNYLFLPVFPGFLLFLFHPIVLVLDLIIESRKHQHFASNPIMLVFMTRVIKISRKAGVGMEEVI